MKNYKSALFYFESGRFKILLSILFFIIQFGFLAEEQEKKVYIYRGLFRINTNISAGEKKLSEIVQKAKGANVDFIVVSDQFLVKCRYGVYPLRNLFSVYKEKKSISRFGIENYLNLLKKESVNTSKPLIIPGIDIAPHYFWEYDRDGKLVCRQFSQQLTIFGDINSEFMRNLPIIHNSRYTFSFSRDLKRISPILLIIISFLLFRRKIWYHDSQGNKYYAPQRKINYLTAFAIFAIAILLLIDNKPFVEEIKFDQYKDYGFQPYQELIDYVKNYNENFGVAWSAPEAKSKNNIIGVNLITEKYPEALLKTKNYDGFAAIYADARTAHLPGNIWDQALFEYCSGKRKKAPFAFGELDYHKDFPNIPFDYIKTFIFSRNPNPDKNEIIKALLNGNSYASIKKGESEIIIDSFTLFSADGKLSLPGETAKIANNSCEICIKAHIEGDKKLYQEKFSLAIIANGKLIAEKSFVGDNFEIIHQLKNEDLPNPLNYVRFLINSPSTEIISNPIFILKNN